MNGTPHKYFAFISYSSANEKWAKWLHSHLEGYRIPSTLHKEHPDMPKKIRPVFWYKKDLSGTELKASLEKELKTSNYLIVICSPQSAKSEWVNDEVATFISEGRGDKIIPFIVDGEPHSADANRECFCPALRSLPREREIRGIDATASGRSHALIDVIATMFGVGFDTLWQRHKRRQRKIKNIWLCVLAAALLAGLAVFDYTRTKTEYYADIVDSKGIMTGIFPLDKETFGHRKVSVQMSYRRAHIGQKDFYCWRLVDVKAVNSKGVAQGSLETLYGTGDLHYTYDNGTPTTVALKDNYGRTIRHFQLRDGYDGTPCGIIDIGGTELAQTSGYLSTGEQRRGIDTSTKIKRLCISRNAAGHVVKKTFHSNNDDDLAASAIANENGVFGERFDLDSLGRILRVSYINNEGQPTTDKYGVAGFTNGYDSHSANNRCVAYFGADGQAVYGKDKYAFGLMAYDKWGNPIGQKLLDPEKRPCYGSDNYAIRSMVYDKGGNQIEDHTFGTDSLPTINKYGWARQTAEYDRRGRPIRVSAFGTDGTPCYESSGIHTQQQSYDGRDRIVSCSNYDIDGNACYNKDGYSVSTWEYDEDGYVTVSRSYGTDGNPCIAKIGVAEIRVVYDTYHRVVDVSYYDTEGHPCNRDRLYHRMHLTYDSRGNRIREDFFGTDGKPTITADNYASDELEYDNYGNITGQRCLGTDGKLRMYDGYAYYQETFMPNGLSASQRYFDADGKPAINSQWYSTVNFEYDKDGNCIRMEHRDTDSSLCIQKDCHAAILTKEYDSAGNETAINYFDVYGRPTISAYGYATVRMEYDKQRRLIKEEYFDAEGRPSANSTGEHARIFVRDARGNISEELHRGIDGRLVADKNGVARYVYTHDDLDRSVRDLYYGADGKPSLHKDYYSEGSYVEYDDYGRRRLLQRTDHEGHPTRLRHSITDFAQQLFRYDERGQVVETLFLNPDSTLCESMSCARMAIEYDERGRERMLAYFDAKGNPMLNASFFAKEVATRPTEDSTIWDMYDINDRHLIRSVTVRKNGFDKRSYWADSLGHPVVYSNPYFFDNIPFAKAEYTLDAFHRVTRFDYYDETGSPMPRDKGIASRVFTYDTNGNLIESRILDEKGHFHSLETEVSHTLIDVDAFGRTVKQRWLDIYDKPAQTPWGYWGYEYVYDEYGKAKRTYFMCDGSTADSDAINKNTNNPIDVTDDEDENLKPVMTSILLASVEGTGQMWDAGYKGVFVILQFNDWETGRDGFDEFAEALTSGRGKSKHMVFWRFDENAPTEGEVYEVTFNEAPLAARIMDQQCPNDQMARLAMWKLAQWREKGGGK